MLYGADAEIEELGITITSPNDFLWDAGNTEYSPLRSIWMNDEPKSVFFDTKSESLSKSNDLAKSDSEDSNLSPVFSDDECVSDIDWLAEWMTFQHQSFAPQVPSFECWDELFTTPIMPSTGPVLTVKPENADTIEVIKPIADQCPVDGPIDPDTFFSDNVTVSEPLVSPLVDGLNKDESKAQVSETQEQQQPAETPKPITPAFKAANEGHNSFPILAPRGSKLKAIQLMNAMAPKPKRLK